MNPLLVLAFCLTVRLPFSLRTLWSTVTVTPIALYSANDIILKHFDSVDKRFKELEEKQRVNDVRITELGAKLTRRK